MEKFNSVILCFLPVLPCLHLVFSGVLSGLISSTHQWLRVAAAAVRGLVQPAVAVIYFNHFTYGMIDI